MAIFTSLETTFSELYMWVPRVSTIHCVGEETKEEATNAYKAPYPREAMESSGHGHDSEVSQPSSKSQLCDFGPVTQSL